MIKGVALDLEGTVVNLETAHVESNLRVLKKLGISMSFEEFLRAIPTYIGGGNEHVAQRIAELPGIKVTWEQIREMKLREFEQIRSEMKIEVRPGFLEVFDHLRAIDMPVAIGSLTATTQAEVLLDRSGLSRLIPREMTVLREDVKRVKPAPDVFLETARRMGIDPADQLVFEDSANGSRAALAAGSRVIGMPIFRVPKALHDLIEVGVTRMFLDWREMSITALFENLSNEGEAH